MHAGRGPQTRTEQRVEELAQRVAELAQVQTFFGRTFMVQVGGWGARWGMQTEAAFRAGMRTILKDLGLRSERDLIYDFRVVFPRRFLATT